MSIGNDVIDVLLNRKKETPLTQLFYFLAHIRSGTPEVKKIGDKKKKSSYASIMLHNYNAAKSAASLPPTYLGSPQGPHWKSKFEYRIICTID